MDDQEGLFPFLYSKSNKYNIIRSSIQGCVEMDKKLFKALIISAVIVLLYYFFITPFGIFNKADFFFRDFITRCVYKFSKPQVCAKDIVVISIDRESLRRLNYNWPWTRDIFAQFLSKIKQYKAKTIYLDFAFVGKTEYDPALAKAVSESGNVILPFYFNETGNPVFPEQTLIESAAGFGPVNKIRDEDMTVRDALLVYFSNSGNIIDYSVELVILCNYLGVTIDKISSEKDRFNTFVNIAKDGGMIKIPVRKNGALHINYSVGLNDIKVIPFWKIISEDQPEEIFKDKIVILGLTDKDILDAYRTPLGMSSGVEIIINTITTMLSGDFIKYVSKDADLSILLLIVLLITIAVIKFSPWKSFLMSLAMLSVYLCFILLLANYGYYFDVFHVLFISILMFIVIVIYKHVALLEEQNSDLQIALKDLKDAETELIKQEKLAAIGRLSAQLSHEINNPLCAIQNNVNTIIYIIKHSGNINEISDIGQQINGEVDRLSRLSRNILNFSRPLVEKAKLISVNETIEDVVNFYNAQFKEHNIRISTDLFSALPKITTSPDRLKQVFSNLIINAQDAMSSGGELKISTKILDKGRIEIRISDTGCGISDEDMKKLFTPFFTTKEEGKGTGLGLFTVYNIIKEYGGTLNIESELGKGTTFIITLPVTGG